MPWDWQRLIQTALEEDIGVGDLTTLAIVPAAASGRLRFVAREPLVACGLEAIPRTYAALDGGVRVELCTRDGQAVERGACLAEARGPAQALLSGERVALNIVQRLSGIATLTRRAVEQVAGYPVHLLDTRKTTPGLRVFERYAVTTGGAKSHRFGLGHAILIKDNHIAAAGGVAAAIRRAKAASGPMVTIEVEVDTLEQLEEALAEGPDGILLDNMDVETMRAAVARVGGRCWTEASGGIRFENLRAIAATGVNYISMGWLTHSARAVDIGADWDD